MLMKMIKKIVQHNKIYACNHVEIKLKVEMSIIKIICLMIIQKTVIIKVIHKVRNNCK